MVILNDVICNGVPKVLSTLFTWNSWSWTSAYHPYGRTQWKLAADVKTSWKQQTCRDEISWKAGAPRGKAVDVFYEQHGFLVYQSFQKLKGLAIVMNQLILKKYSSLSTRVTLEIPALPSSSPPSATCYPLWMLSCEEKGKTSSEGFIILSDTISEIIG